MLSRLFAIEEEPQHASHRRGRRLVRHAPVAVLTTPEGWNVDRPQLVIEPHPGRGAMCGRLLRHSISNREPDRLVFKIDIAPLAGCGAISELRAINIPPSGVMGTSATLNTVSAVGGFPGYNL